MYLFLPEVTLLDLGWGHKSLVKWQNMTGCWLPKDPSHLSSTNNTNRPSWPPRAASLGDRELYVMIMRLQPLQAKINFSFKISHGNLLDFQRFIFLLWMQFFFSECNFIFRVPSMFRRLVIQGKNYTNHPFPSPSLFFLPGHFTAQSHASRNQRNQTSWQLLVRAEVSAKCTVKWVPVWDSEDAVSSCASTTYQIRQHMVWLRCIWAWRSHSPLTETSALLLILGVTVGGWINLNSSPFIDLDTGNDT